MSAPHSGHVPSFCDVTQDLRACVDVLPVGAYVHAKSFAFEDYVHTHVVGDAKLDASDPNRHAPSVKDRIRDGSLEVVAISPASLCSVASLMMRLEVGAHPARLITSPFT
jgi:hypothetical protein